MSADKTFLGRRMMDFSSSPAFQPFSRVTLWVDDNNCYTAGDDSGRTLEADCPWATQDVCNAVLARVNGYQYVPYTAADSMIDPAAEIGDGVTVNGRYSVLASIEAAFDTMYTANTEAPSDEELDHEFPYKPSTTRAFDRKLAQTRAAITVKADEIMAKVEDELDSISSYIDVKLDNITSTVQGIDGRVSAVEQTASGLTTSVQGLSGRISTVEQTASGLTSTVQGINGNINKIEQTLEGVAFTSDLYEGKSIISGGCIKTGQISADFIKLGGWMYIYDSISSDAVTGRFGKTSLTVDNETKDALGFISMSNLTIGSTGVCAIASNGKMYIRADRDIEFGTSDCDVNFRTDTVKFRGVAIWYVSSDERLKQDIDYDVSDKLCTAFDALRPVTFRFQKEKMRGQDHIGFIAQDVLAAIEDAGLGNALTDVDCDGYYALNYGEMVALLTAKIKQLEKRLEVLEQ